MRSLAPPCGQSSMHTPPPPPPPRRQVLSRAEAPPGPLCWPPSLPWLTASAYPPFRAPGIYPNFLNPQILPCPALGEALTQSGGPTAGGAPATVPAAHWSVGGAAARGLGLSSVAECWRALSRARAPDLALTPAASSAPGCLGGFLYPLQPHPVVYTSKSLSGSLETDGLL